MSNSTRTAMEAPRMESLTSWSSDRVCGWLEGLDSSLQVYPFSEWELSGVDLLQLSSQDLEALGVCKIGHQELILEAVEQLCFLMYGMGGENLRTLTEKLHVVASGLQMGIQSRWRTMVYEGKPSNKLPASVLQLVVDLITSAKGVFALLNRYQFFQLSGYTASKSIIAHCRELEAIVHKDTTVFEKEKDIIAICRNFVVVCDEVLTSTPDAVLAHTARLESVDLVPASPGYNLGIEITSTGSGTHYVTGTTAECPADFSDKVLTGDEVVDVNGQIVVGWSRTNLLKKLQEDPRGVTLVLKKFPRSLRRKDKTQESSSTQKEKEERTEKEEARLEEEEHPRHSILDRVASSVRSLSFRKVIHEPEAAHRPMGQEESELSSNSGLDGQFTVMTHNKHCVESESLDGSKLSLRPRSSLLPRSSSPLLGTSRNASPQGRASISSLPADVGGLKEQKETKKATTKGTATTMSRRRVSCRELGRPDCDGWLWKKRKESSVFIAQKWQRFWFVLKGPSLYWYNSQQEEKADGLVQISSYRIESAGEHKRKYVFKMYHQRFQTFYFAADNVTDMSKWINCLITAIQKHKTLHKDPPDTEEECYSETDSEDEVASSRNKNKKVQSNTLTRPKGKKTIITPSTFQSTGGSKETAVAPPAVDEMGVLFSKIIEVGVSLTGQEQPLTHAHFRKSFIRRNKNPVINEKAHALRALQSTLKAREAELLVINKILEDSELTPVKYRTWKEANEELCQEIEKLAQLRASKEMLVATKDPPAEAVDTEIVAAETATTEKMVGVSRLSLSHGEQLVDAEPSDVFLEIPPGTPTLESPTLDICTGSLQDSIDKELQDMANNSSSGVAKENYFFI